MRMFHMANDSHLFRAPGDGLLPLYEAKMMWQFDHRFTTYEGATQEQINVGILPQPTPGKRQTQFLCQAALLGPGNGSAESRRTANRRGASVWRLVKLRELNDVNGNARPHCFWDFATSQTLRMSAPPCSVSSMRGSWAQDATCFQRRFIGRIRLCFFANLTVWFLIM